MLIQLQVKRLHELAGLDDCREAGSENEKEFSHCFFLIVGQRNKVVKQTGGLGANAQNSQSVPMDEFKMRIFLLYFRP